MASPSNMTGTKYTNAYIGAETFLNKREIHKQIFDTYREPEGLVDLLTNLGYKRKTANTTYHWWEDDFLMNSVTIASVAGLPSAPGDSITITIDAASHQESGTTSPFQVSDLVMIGEMRGRISATNKTVDNAHTYTIEPVDSIEDWDADASPVPAVGVDVVSYGNAHADGTLQPGSKARKPIRYNNNTQIMKHVYETHGSESANESEVMVNGRPYFYRKGVQDTYKRLMIDTENTLFLGQRSVGLNDTTAPDGTGPVNTTEGLQKSIENRGITQTYVTWDYAESEKMTRSLNLERTAKEYCGLLAQNFLLDHESAMHTRTQNTAIDYAMFRRNSDATTYKGDKKGKALSFGINSYQLGGFTFHMKKWESLTYVPVTGYTNSKYLDRGYFLPFHVVKDPMSKKKMDTVSLMFKSNDLGNRFMKEDFKDRFKIDGKDSYQWDYLCDWGLRLALVNGYLAAEK